MKKTLIATAVAAGMLASGAALAEPTVYGILHLSIDTYGDDHLVNGSVFKTKELNMTSHTSAIGIKGSEDLGNGLKAIYKVEFQINPDERCSSDDVTTSVAGLDTNGSGDIDTLQVNTSTSGCDAITDRDQWIGLKGGWGKVAFGTMSSNYKQMGGKIDPLYRTEAEGRGILNMQSGQLHGGAGISRGRMTNAVQYTTPKMAGIEVVVNTTVSGVGANNSNADETIGAGIRWSNKSILLFADYIDPSANGSTGNDESAFKVGGKFNISAFQVSAQYEATEDQDSGDYIFLNGLWNINANNAVTASWGQQDKISDAYALAYVHMLSKQTNVYAGYAAVNADSCTATTCTYNLGTDANGTPYDKGTVFTFGMRKSF